MVLASCKSGRRVSAALLALVLFPFPGPASGAPVPAPDLIIYDAKIVTVDGRFSVARAAAVKDGRFTAVGSDAAVLKTAGPRTVKVDLHGRTVLPGFNDSHVHLVRGGDYELQVDLADARSIADIQTAVAARVRTAKPGEFLFGSRGWWDYELSEKRRPNRYDLDKVSPGNPVVIPGYRYVVANSLALKAAGVTQDAKSPAGGEIVKDGAGEPTGVLLDDAARLVMKFQPRPTMEQQIAGVRRLQARANANGITSIGDPGETAADAQVYRRLYEAGQLSLRVDFGYNVDPTQPLDQAEAVIKALGSPGQTWGDGMFRSDEIGEVGVDGNEMTAMLRQDYPDRPGYRGVQRIPTEQLKQFAALANRYGWRLRPHVVGDAAIDQVLDAYEYADAQKSIVGRRWMLEHALLLGPDHYPRVRALGLVVNSQYMQAAQLGQAHLVAWKRPLADRIERYRDWLAAGVMFANGSDGAPISNRPDPLYEIYGVVTRGTLWGGKLGPDQGISREQAIRSVTINGAYTSFEEKVKGSIEPGKYADFVVLSQDLLAVPADRIKDIRVLATVLGGRTVYGALDRPAVRARAGRPAS
ncbi:MAG TPA: amidohydrolase [Caulobacteraceae bacterium]|nr:amidohydrolase [Caulobacteraceae bacterium]